jgi:4-amino-4-deoxy-L-arabinose transferase-like glycosyltransferase
MNTLKISLVLAAIAIISLLMHLNHFNKDIISIHAWRQTQTQTNIVNFYEEDMNILNPRKNDRANGSGIYRMEFPIMQWSVACLYKVFGKNILITRISMFVIGLFSILGLYRLLLVLFQNTYIALIGAWTFNFSPCFYYYTINPLPDNFALWCSIWGMTFFMEWYRNRKNYQLLLIGFLLCLGTLTKLPFILYYAVPFTYFLILIYHQGFNKQILVAALSIFMFLVFPLLWYISVIPQWHGNGIVLGMMDNSFSILTILDYFQHNLFSTLPELLINYGSVLFFLAGFYFLYARKSYKHELFIPIIIWSASVVAYFVFEINMIEKVHDYYLFPFYPLIFMLVSYGAFHFYMINRKMTKRLTIALLLILPFTCYLRMQERWSFDSPGFNADLLLYKSDLQKAVPKNALVVVGNDSSPSIYFYHLDKKGWYFKEDQLTKKGIEHMIQCGAQYMYSDSRIVDQRVGKYLDSLILEKGTFKVYRLKNTNAFL